MASSTPAAFTSKQRPADTPAAASPARRARPALRSPRVSRRTWLQPWGWRWPAAAAQQPRHGRGWKHTPAEVVLVAAAAMQKMGPKVWRGIWFRPEAHLRDSPCWVRVSKRGFKHQPGGRFYCMSSLVRPKAMGSLHRTLTRTLSDTLSCIINVAEFSPKKNTPKGVSHRHDGILDGNAIGRLRCSLRVWAFQNPGLEMIRPPSKCVGTADLYRGVSGGDPSLPRWPAAPGRFAARADFPAAGAGPAAALPSFAASSQPGLG